MDSDTVNPQNQNGQSAQDAVEDPPAQDHEHHRASVTGSQPIHLTGLTRSEMTELMLAWGQKPFRARQIWSWLHVRNVSKLDAMTDISKAFRAEMGSKIAPLRPAVVDHRVSRDGTQKWLLRLNDGQRIETVFIPEDCRGTLCLSTQAGCTLNCSFCCTGSQGFARNLEAFEIVEQVLLAREILAHYDCNVTNLVLMGMGEPLYNYKNVAQALKILMDGDGVAIGTRKVTLSTVGVLPEMARVGRELGVNLAISLHALRDDLRNELVPLNRKYDLAALQKAARDFPLKSGRRITWEYVLLDGINDSVNDARALIKYLKGIPSKINLIPFNPWPGAPYHAPSEEAVLAFRDTLHSAGMVTVVRVSRGADIAAACGQLKGELQGVKARRTSSHATARASL